MHESAINDIMKVNVRKRGENMETKCPICGAPLADATAAIVVTQQEAWNRKERMQIRILSRQKRSRDSKETRMTVQC